MTIETDDIQALDLLSSPSASIVYLERSINEKRRDLQRIVSETCGQAVFWPSTEGAAADSASSNRRQLMGEIHLRGHLQPSSAVPGLVIEVRPFLAALASNLFILYPSMRWSSSLFKRQGSRRRRGNLYFGRWSR